MSAPAHALPVTTGRGIPARSAAGLPAMLRLVWRRNRVRLLVWLLVIVGMYEYIAAYYTDTFTTQKSLDDFAALSATPGMKAITGLSDAANTMGGAVWTKGWMTVVLALSIGIVFLVTRTGRADEETGRTELLRSRVLGIHAYSVASWISYAILALLVGLGMTGVSVANHLDPDGTGIAGSLVLGGSVTGIGLVGLGVGALAGQLAQTSRGANALGSAILVGLYVVRMIADLGTEGLSWLSPYGWGQRMQPYATNSWGPFALMIALALVLLAAAWILESRRDYGVGLLPERLGKAGAPKRYASPLGLALRLERNAILGWTIAIALCGLMFGSVVESMTKLLDDAGPNVDALLCGSGVTALVARLVSMMALITVIFALQTTVSLRGDEATGIIEPQLAGAVGRRRWSYERLLIPAVWSAVLLLIGGGFVGAVYGASIDDASQGGRLALAALAYWPAVMVYVGLALVLWAFVPRISTPIAWALMVATWFLTMFGEVFGIPDKVLDALPLAATPYLPFEEFSWTPILILMAVALVLVVIGVEGFSRRDVKPA
ncbi:ABC transporter permease [Actinomyces culturomici]|uniref:ABC transporter permease n=1 Tax=Actinomyces culturomici TaxID=1926276 RepID=UPI000E1FEB26|nr:ABC transporter permease [Actinomyces culturomici]